MPRSPRVSIPLTSRPDGSPMPTKRPVNAQPDPDRVVPHLAMRALVSLRAVDACLDAIDGPHREGALRALRSLHEPKAVEGLIKKLATARSPEARREILATLVRLYHREADYQGSWWGIRPDTTGPYFDPREWESSGRIASVLKAAVLDGDADTVTFLRGELARRRVRLKGLPADSAAGSPKAEEEIRVVIAKADPKNADQIGNMTYEAAASAGTPGQGRCGARQDPLRRPVVPRLPHRRRRPDAQGAAPGGHRQALQPRRARGVDPEAQRQDRPGVRGLRLRDGRRPGLHGLRRQRGGLEPCRSASRRVPCTS